MEAYVTFDQLVFGVLAFGAVAVFGLYKAMKKSDPEGYKVVQAFKNGEDVSKEAVLAEFKQQADRVVAELKATADKLK